MATFKQYLQNRWYRGMSQDRSVAYPYQFQYGRNINVRNEKGAVMLSSLPTRIDTSSGYYANLIKMQPAMNDLTYALKYDSDNNACGLYQGDMTGTVAVDLGDPIAIFNSWRQPLNPNKPFGPRIVPFRDGVFVVNSQSGRIYLHPGDDYVEPNPGDPIEYPGVMAETITSALEVLDDTTYAGDNTVHCVYNFADTFFLVAYGGVLLRYQPITNIVTDIPNWKVIRYFGSAKTIVGLSQSGNYLKIYVTDGFKTQCHYAQGTFDLEESGMVQTVDFEGVLIEDCLVSDGTKDYGLFKTNIGIQLLEMDGYDYNIIRKTERRYTEVGTVSEDKIMEYIFYDEYYTGAKLVWYDNVLYCSLPSDGIWTFTKESVGSHGWVWGGVVEWGIEDFMDIDLIFIFKTQQIIIQNGIMLTLHLNPLGAMGSQDYWTLGRTEINDYPEHFVPDGYIIGNIYDGGCGSLFKKNVSTTLVCGNSTPRTRYANGTIQLGYRYDRVNNSLLNFNYGVDWVKTIETSGIYDSVFITSTQQPIQGVAPDTTPRMFNKPRNTIEYIMVLSVPRTSAGGEPIIQDAISPILYEHNLIYEDSMRKYR